MAFQEAPARVRQFHDDLKIGRFVMSSEVKIDAVEESEISRKGLKELRYPNLIISLRISLSLHEKVPLT